MLEDAWNNGLCLRKKEYSQIWMLLEMFMKSVAPISLLVIAFGETGTGKTTLAKRIMLNATSAWNNLKTIYLDLETTYCSGLFTALQRALKSDGYSAVEIIRALEESGYRFFIVMDNAEYIMREEVLKDILKIGECFPRGGFFILMLSSLENPQINPVGASSPLYILHFERYNLREIRMILDHSLNRLGRSLISDEALDAISRASDGNAKLALNLLKISLDLSGGRIIDESLVLKALKEVSENPSLYTHSKILDPHSKVVLKILSEYAQGIRLRRLFEEYTEASEKNGIKPLRYTQLWKRVKMLEKRGILDFKVANIRGGRTGLVKVRCVNGISS
jgi:Cdc6-like AAA superfamily ATPase